MSTTISKTDNGTDDIVSTYIKSINNMSKSTAANYFFRLRNFENFVAKEYGNHLTVNDLIAKIKKAILDPYSVLNAYVAYLRNCNITTSTLKQRIVTIKNFLEFGSILSTVSTTYLKTGCGFDSPRSLNDNYTSIHRVLGRLMQYFYFFILLSFVLLILYY